MSTATTPENPGATEAGVRSMLGRSLLTAALAGPALGALGGWLWWLWWGPAGKGQIYDTSVGPTWYPDPLSPGLTRGFDGVATFVIIGAGLGLLLGALAALAHLRTALAGVVAVLVAAGLACAVMVAVGYAFSPADPATLVASHKVGDRLPEHLDLDGWTPFLAWPVGAMLGYFVVMITLVGPASSPAPRSDESGPQG